MQSDVARDLSWFAISLVVNVALFFTLHLAVFRLVRVRRIARAINASIAASVVLGALVQYVFLRSAWSSSASFAVGLAGSCLFSVFLLGFYGFAGPICADRSPSAHMALFLLDQAHGLTPEELRACYPYERVFDRRLEDFARSGIVVLEGGRLKLTRKGAAITSAYALLARLLRIPDARLHQSSVSSSTAPSSRIL